eukprot:g3831.t1
MASRILIPNSTSRTPLRSRRGFNRKCVSQRRHRCLDIRVHANHRTERRVVITSLGVVTAFGNNVDQFYNRLLAGDSAVKPITKFDVSSFSTKFAAEIDDFDPEGLIDSKNLRRYDDCIKYAIVAGKKALKSTGLDMEDDRSGFSQLDKFKCGVLVGSGMGGLTVFSDSVKTLIERGQRRLSPFFIPYSITNMAGAILGIETGFMGPNYSISTACATANYAFVAAANHIRRGEADLIIAGGSEAAIVPIGLGGFIACRALSKRNDAPEKASRPWDKTRDGFVMGEGCGVLIMESLDHALDRGAHIICEYLGGWTNCDAHHMTEPRSDGLGVSTCIEGAIEDACIEKEMINYVNAHATSTPVGDIAEIKALRKVFTNSLNLVVNGTKSMLGHELGAAAGIEAVATVQAIKTGYVHPTLNQEDLEDEMRYFNTVPNGKEKLEITAAMSNSFGFGGHNSAVIFAPYSP